MRCKKAMAQFSAYLDGQLPAAERKAVRTHLAGCARCRAELESLDRTAYALADLPRLRAPSDLRDRVMEKIASETPAEEARRPRWLMYWGAAAAVLFAIAIMLLTTPETPRRKERVASVPPHAGFERLAAAPKQAPPVAVALARRGASAGVTNAEENALQTLSNAQPTGGPVISLLAAPAVTNGSGTVLLPPNEQVGFSFRSVNPRADYASAVSVAAKGGWLPQRAADELLKAGETERGRPPLLRLKLWMKRSQVPLLEKALADADLKAFAVKSGEARLQLAEELRPQETPAQEAQAQEAQPMPAAGPPQLKGARVDRLAAQPAAAAAPAGAGGVVAGKAQPISAEGAQETESAAPQQEWKAAAEDPIVEVTLDFALEQIPVPATAPAAGAANSTTAAQHGDAEGAEKQVR
jgi:hypothetical protein